MPNEVFISYSQGDKPAADRICEILEGNGISCWIAPRNITPGTTWANAIVRAIERCKVMLLICSPTANESRQVSRELQLADDRKATIVPVRLANIELAGDIRYFLDNTQWFDAFPGTVDDHADRLVRAVRQAMLPPGERTATAAAGFQAPVAATAPQKPAQPVLPPPVAPRQSPAMLVAAAATVLLLGGGAYWYITQPATDTAKENIDPAITKPEPDPPKPDPPKPSPAKRDPDPEPPKPAPAAKIAFVKIPEGPKFPGGFMLGKRPVTVGEFQRFVTETHEAVMPPPPPSNPLWSDQDRPIVRVGPIPAAKFCAWAGGRLPTFGEMQHAGKQDPSLGIGSENWERLLSAGWIMNADLQSQREEGIQKRSIGFRCIAD